ncbi:MAG TPA: 2-phospho-L-lactate guanylyltransferase [Steroidobacteraceae bacterium]|nr:2-phospho-L-lactate guanylyltransferase [Steroidobacteraceae bacterium]
MSVHAVVPLKALAVAKSRLAGVLSAPARERLVRTMLADVTAALLATRGITRVHVLTADPGLVPPRCTHLADDGDALNDALRRAAGHLTRAGARAMLIVPADLPAAEQSDFALVLAAGEERGIVLVPDERGEGTNALLLTPPGLIAPQFGARSLAAHLAAARRVGIEPRIVRNAQLASDIDDAGQLAELAARREARYEFLQSGAG